MMFWYLIFCSLAVYFGFAILVGKIFASDDPPNARHRAEFGAWEGDAAAQSAIEDELRDRSWTESLHALFLPEAL
ncbi:MAG TPA: hypothetical protein VN766_15600 [Stellaceae bacterium]|jgi:hypothetical protein|nr:hypothetical protein [Stellaceae bacterium]